jgi:predicted 2-oxoglutarate/Fe(II)-dependent dioxygenase YbiX
MQTLPTPTETGYTRLAAFVHVFDDVFSTDFCNNIIKEYKEIDFVDAVDHGAGYRQCMGAKILNNADKKRKEIDNTIFDSLQKILLRMKEIHPTLLGVSDDTGYELLRYKVGDYYKPHIDAGTIDHRVLSCIIGLNEDYLGGEIDMFNGAAITKLRTGSLMVWPSNFMFPHGIRPVTQGIRYSIVTWFNYGNPDNT